MKSVGFVLAGPSGKHMLWAFVWEVSKRKQEVYKFERRAGKVRLTVCGRSPRDEIRKWELPHA